MPFKRWSGILGTVTPVPAEWAGKVSPALPQKAANVIERNVALLIRSASQHLPWEPSCLAQATATQILLRRRHSGGVVVIGLRKNVAPPLSEYSKVEWMAHAWLLGLEGALSGGPAAEGFVATTLFTLPHGLQPTDVAALFPDGTGA